MKSIREIVVAINISIATKSEITQAILILLQENHESNGSDVLVHVFKVEKSLLKKILGQYGD